MSQQRNVIAASRWQAPADHVTSPEPVYEKYVNPENVMNLEHRRRFCDARGAPPQYFGSEAHPPTTPYGPQIFASKNPLSAYLMHFLCPIMHFTAPQKQKQKSVSGRGFDRPRPLGELTTLSQIHRPIVGWLAVVVFEVLFSVG